MSDKKLTPQGKQKGKLSENLQVQFKKPTVTNERLVVNKLGMKFDPVCWKKNHEKGRIQFICIENDCKAERRLACAHCVIEEHDEHVSNKITVEQYCETFECNFKCYMFQVAKLEESYNKCKMVEVIDLIDKDINSIVESIRQQLRGLREIYVQDILNYAETNNEQLMSLYAEERATLSKMKEYSNKNLFEMTPAEMDHSMLMMGVNHIESISKKLHGFQDQTANVANILKSQWKVIYDSLAETIKDVITTIGQQNFNFTSSGKETPIDQVTQLLQDQLEPSQPPTHNQPPTQYNLLPTQYNQPPIQFNQPPIQYQQQSQNQPLIQFNQPPPNQQPYLQKDASSQDLKSQASKNRQSNSPRSENKSVKQVSGASSSQMTSPLRNGHATAQFGSKPPNQRSQKNLMQFNSNTKKAQTQARQTSPTGQNYFYQSDGKVEGRKPTNHLQSLSSSQQYSFDKRLSAQKLQPQFTCNHNSMKCIHNDLIKASPIFSCCNWAFPCYECHDMIQNHKAHITVPSQRFCPQCGEIFTVNLMSTVDVKCYKCQ